MSRKRSPSAVPWPNLPALNRLDVDVAARIPLESLAILSSEQTTALMDGLGRVLATQQRAELAREEDGRDA